MFAIVKYIAKFVLGFWCRNIFYKSFKKLDKLVKNKNYREHVTLYLYLWKNRKNLIFIL